jgi:hypothetical protein
MVTRRGWSIVDVMTGLADLANITEPRSNLTRRQRAAKTVGAALRGGLLGAAVAGLGWLVASVVAGIAFIVLIVATVAVIGYQLTRDDVKATLWGALAAGWAVVLIERWAVQEHGGVWVGAAAWLGVVVGARRAGISKWALPLLAYPLALGAIVVASGESLLDPWGISWLWVLAVLGPVLGAGTLLNPTREQPAKGS